MAVPLHISNFRREQCLLCPTPCENRTNLDFHKAPESVCPVGRFPAYVLAESDRKVKGLGDVVAAMAKPIARVSDKVFKTKFVGCRACATRQQKLNEIMPF